MEVVEAEKQISELNTESSPESVPGTSKMSASINDNPMETVDANGDTTADAMDADKSTTNAENPPTEKVIAENAEEVVIEKSAVETGVETNIASDDKTIDSPSQSTDNPSVEKVVAENIPESMHEEDLISKSTDSQMQTASKAVAVSENRTSDDFSSLNANTVNSAVEKVFETAANSNSLETSKKRGPAKKATDAKVANAIGSLGLLNQYASSSDEDEDSSSDEESSSAESDSGDSDVFEVVAGMNVDTEGANSILNKVMSAGNYRDAPDDSDTDSDSDVECIGKMPVPTVDITGDEELKAFLENCDDETPPSGPIRAKGELGIEELPPIEELTITIPESECVQLGTISGVVDTIVLVESFPNFAAVDIDTVLFLDKGNRTLGQVFDVMGVVSSPIYCVRFNKPQDIADKNLKNGIPVYVAPQTQYTNFIVLADLMKQRGCDASWENDNEAPDGCNEFSDDEAEKNARREQNQRQRNRNRTSEQDIPNKVTIKVEPKPQASRTNRQYKNSNRNNAGHQNNKNRNRREPTRFYKDNRGYANSVPNYANFYQPQSMPAHFNYSWHTAANLSQPPPPPPSSTQMIYPNPFAFPNHMPFNPNLSLHAFPPLPPPMSSIPPPQHHQNNRHIQSPAQQQQQQQSPPKPS